VSQIQATEPQDEDIPTHALLPGTSLLHGQYEILRFLNSGGFGITYLARDSLDRDVVIKECFPAALCYREGFKVVASAPEYDKDLASIVSLFIQEARNHAKLIHPHIVPVHQVFEDNDTAYIAMDYIRGYDLLDMMDMSGNNLTPNEFTAFTEKLLSAVSFIHEHGMLHRDISPDNILIDEHNEPVLIDFGAAREQAAHRNAALVTLRVVKEGYSPQEFYVPGSVQGPYSDLYVLAATLYHVMVGEPPVDGKTRFDAYDKQIVDPYVPVAGRFEGYPQGFLEAIDKAMSVMPARRQQSALEWLQMFRGPQAVFGATSARPTSVIAALGEADGPIALAEPEVSNAEAQARIQAEVDNAESVVAAMLSGATSVTEKRVDAPLKAANDIVVNKAPSTETQAMQHVKTMLNTEKTDALEHEGADAEVVETDGNGEGAHSAASMFGELSPQEQSAPAGRKNGMLLGGVAALALLAVGAWLTLGSEPDVAAPVIVAQPVVVEETSQEIDVPSMVAETPVVETAAIEMASSSENAETLEVSIETPVVEAAETPAVEVVEPLAVEVVEAPAAELVETSASVLKEQVAFAHWDVEMPFTTSTRRTSNASLYLVNSIGNAAEMQIVGSWVERGTAIYSVNNQAAQSNVSLAGLMLRELRIGNDGYTHASARYKQPGNNRFMSGSIALPVIQIVGLKNGMVVSEAAARSWQVEVTRESGVPGDQLRKGDIILREENTGVSLRQRGAFTSVLGTLSEGAVTEARFVVNRNGAEVFAQMPLALE